MGVPRVWDREKVFNDLLEWSKLPDSINLCAFCAKHSLPATLLIRWQKEDENFSQTYEVAKLNLAAKRETMLNNETLHVKAYDLNATNYDVFLRDEKRSQAEFESALKERENKPLNDKDNNEILDYIKSQKEQSEKT